MYTGFVVAERLMYISSIGYCILMGTLFESILFGNKENDNEDNVVVIQSSNKKKKNFNIMIK